MLLLPPFPFWARWGKDLASSRCDTSSAWVDISGHAGAGEGAGACPRCEHCGQGAGSLRALPASPHLTQGSFERKPFPATAPSPVLPLASSLSMNDPTETEQTNKYIINMKTKPERSTKSTASNSYPILIIFLYIYTHTQRYPRSRGRV